MLLFFASGNLESVVAFRVVHLFSELRSFQKRNLNPLLKLERIQRLPKPNREFKDPMVPFSAPGLNAEAGRSRSHTVFKSDIVFRRPFYVKLPSVLERER